MKKLILFLLLSLNVFADTPAPTNVGIKFGGILIDPRQIRALAFGTDSITAYQGGVWNISTTNDPNVNIHDSGGGSLGSTGTSLNVDVTNIVPVSQNGTFTTGRTWTLLNTTDSVNIGNFPASQTINGSVSVSNFPATQNVAVTNTPTVTANIGTTNGLALDSTLSGLSAKFGSLGQKPMSGSAPVVIASDQSAIAVTGSITTSPDVNIHDSGGGSLSSTSTSLNVDVTNTVPVTGTFFQATQPVSATSLPLPTNAAQEAGGHLSSIDTKLTSPITVTGSLGRTWTLGHAADSVTDWLNDGMGNAITSQVNSGQRALDVGIDVLGVQIDPRQIRTLTTSDNVTANAGTNLNTSALNLEATQSAFKSANHTDLLAINTTLGSPMQNSGGSVTANAGTNLNTSALALSATQTNGTQKSQQVDGSGNVQPAGDIASRKVFVQPTDGTNSQGYTASSEAKVLVTPLTSSSTVTVVQPTGTNLHTVVDSGTVTANAGTNLNTSLLALQSGANTMLDRSGSGTITALNQAITFTTNGMSSVDINVTGTWTATLGIEGQAGDGTWTALNCSTIGSDIILQAFLNNNQAQCAIGGFNQVRVRASAFTSGSASIQYNLGSGVNNVHVMNFSAGSLQVTANAGTNLNTSLLALDTSVTGLQVSQGSTTSGQKGGLSLGAVTTSVPSYTTAQTSPLSLNLHGAIRELSMGGDTAQLIRNAYSSTNVTTAAYVQLVASTSVEINRLHIFDSSGQDLVLAVGGAGSEVDQIQIPPGGWDQVINLYIPSGSRISVKAVSATASSGILLITGLK